MIEESALHCITRAHDATTSNNRIVIERRDGRYKNSFIVFAVFAIQSVMKEMIDEHEQLWQFYQFEKVLTVMAAG